MIPGIIVDNLLELLLVTESCDDATEQSTPAYTL